MNETRSRSVGLSDAVITLVLLGAFVYVVFEALSWPTRSQLAPLTLAGLGVLFCLLKLAQLVVANVRHRSAVAAPEPAVVAAGAPSDVVVGEDEDDDTSLDYAFTSSSRQTWTRVMLWIVGFFISLYVFGFYVVVPLFSVAYLALEGRVRLRWAVLAAVITGGLIYGVFALALDIQVPEGALW
jgi:hypothetical protein